MALVRDRVCSLPPLPGREASDVFWTKDELCPHPTGLSLVMAETREILTNTVQWLFCGCREDFNFWGIKPPSIRVAQLLRVMQCCIQEVADSEALEISGIHSDGLIHSISSFPPLCNVNPV